AGGARAGGPRAAGREGRQRQDDPLLLHRLPQAAGYSSQPGPARASSVK
ncbi:unnamed protein product, partial [Heterosigma akashiwo]